MYFHINICSLQAKSETFDTLISKLDYIFSVIAASEACKSSAKDIIPEIVTYQPFYGTNGTSTKISCGFYRKQA